MSMEVKRFDVKRNGLVFKVIAFFTFSIYRFGMDAFLLRDIIYATTSLINTDYEYKQVSHHL